MSNDIKLTVTDGNGNYRRPGERWAEVVPDFIGCYAWPFGQHSSERYKCDSEADAVKLLRACGWTVIEAVPVFGEWADYAFTSFRSRANNITAEVLTGRTGHKWSVRYKMTTLREGIAPTIDEAKQACDAYLQTFCVLKGGAFEPTARPAIKVVRNGLTWRVGGEGREVAWLDGDQIMIEGEHCADLIASSRYGLIIEAIECKLCGRGYEIVKQGGEQ